VPVGMVFPISRDPPEGGTRLVTNSLYEADEMFPISRDPPEGGTRHSFIFRQKNV